MMYKSIRITFKNLCDFVAFTVSSSWLGDDLKNDVGSTLTDEVVLAVDTFQIRQICQHFWGWHDASTGEK